MIRTAYLDQLKGLPRMVRLRLLDGLWVAAEGVVYDSWDPVVHLLEEADAPKTFKRVFASKDWGFTEPGVTLVWGTDVDGRIYRIGEIYRTRETIEWWIKRDTELRERFGIERFVCDPAEPGLIQLYRDAGLRVEPGDNDIIAGIRRVERRLGVQKDGKPRLMFVKGRLFHLDERHAQDTGISCTLDEDSHLGLNKLSNNLS